MSKPKNTPASRLAQILKTWRSDNGKTQEDLAALLKVSWHTVQRLESALVQRPSASTALQISKVLSVPLEKILCA